jgi:hypothetical protein
MSRLTRKLSFAVVSIIHERNDRENRIRRDIPDRDNRRKQYEEAEHIDIPQSPEPVQCYEHKRQRKRHRAKNLHVSVINPFLHTGAYELTFASLLISKSSSPTFVSGWLVFMTARVSDPVYTMNPIADPAAKTVLLHKTFSADRGSTVETCTMGTSSTECARGELIVKVPMNVCMSLIGASAEVGTLNTYLQEGQNERARTINLRIQSQQLPIVVKLLGCRDCNTKFPIRLAVKLVSPDETCSRSVARA